VVLQKFPTGEFIDKPEPTADEIIYGIQSGIKMHLDELHEGKISTQEFLENSINSLEILRTVYYGDSERKKSSD
jgi:hypothetical protein